ncbi:IQ domain-containing protein IQM3-like protein [Tanacetum coccineum]|uniref:IQ domain-containing protein IQM3-like protein n=1 Tax=Tanacetum coccineum TaxID=301880 RepID=A0ABQ5GKA5_9ASTR
MGGALAIASSVFVPEIDVAVAFYGVTPTELADAAKIKLPVQAHFGERDNAVGISDIMICRIHSYPNYCSRHPNRQLDRMDKEENAPPAAQKVPDGISKSTMLQITVLKQLANYGAIIDDGTAMDTITYFSPEAHTFVPDCNDVVKDAENKDKHQVDFNLDVAFQASPQPLLSLLAPDLATTPPPEILQQTTSNRTVTETESKPCPMTKDSAERSHTSLEEPKKTAKKLDLVGLGNWSKQGQFIWAIFQLDVGEGKEVDLKECPISTLRKQCIKYLGPQERENYEYIIVEGKIMHLQTQLPLDTNNGEKWICVTSASNRLYAGEKKKGKFHHSSFLARGATLAAGRLDVDNGTLKVATWIYNASDVSMKDATLTKNDATDIVDNAMIMCEPGDWP